MTNFKKLLSIVLVSAMVFPCLSVNAVDENTDNIADEELEPALASNNDEEQTFVLPDVVDETEAKSQGYIGRNKSLEDNLNTFVFNNSDGTNTMKVYAYPVKYVDDNNNTKDITLDIAETDNGSYTTEDNEIKTIFSKKLDDGIMLNYDDINLKLTPNIYRPNSIIEPIKDSSAEISEDNIENQLSEIEDDSNVNNESNISEETKPSLEENESTYYSEDTSEVEQQTDLSSEPVEENTSLTEDIITEELQNNEQSDESDTVKETDNTEIIAQRKEETETVIYQTDENTTYEYSLTYTGFKEDIVVNEYTGQTEYEFTLNTNGLFIDEEMGSYSLNDSAGNKKALIGDIIVFTADEKNNTQGTMTYDTVIPNQEYKLTIHLDADYLKDPLTKYPIRIDPTIEVNYDNNNAGIKDVTIFSNSSSNGSSGSLYVGNYGSYGKARVLMQFPGFDYDNIIYSSKNVQEAHVELTDLICNNTSMAVLAYCFYGKDWDDSTVSWNDVLPDKYVTLLSRKIVKYDNGILLPTPHRYEFSITDAVKRWVDGSMSKTRGIILKAQNNIENGSSTNYKVFASYNRTSYKPCLSVKYNATTSINHFFSKFEPEKYCSEDIFGQINLNNGTHGPNYYTDRIRYRMNCYAYAFGFLLDIGYTLEGTSDGARLYPGELSGDALLDYSNSETYITSLKNNIINDGEELNYQVTEFHPTSSVITQFGTSSRLVALVTTASNNDWHFYMQHSDGTWSHKPGNHNPTNLSLGSHVIITNDNITEVANENGGDSGNYAGGQLRFFTITKSAVMDCCYDSNYNISQVTPSGDNIHTSTSYDNTIKRIDHAYDHDFYSYVPTTFQSYEIEAVRDECDEYDSNYLGYTPSNNLTVRIYNNVGQELTTTNISSKRKIAQLMAGNLYFIEVYNDDDLPIVLDKEWIEDNNIFYEDFIVNPTYQTLEDNQYFNDLHSPYTYELTINPYTGGWQN